MDAMMQYIWANYSNSLTWNKAMLGWVLLFFPWFQGSGEQWGRDSLVRYIGDTVVYSWVITIDHPLLLVLAQLPSGKPTLLLKVAIYSGFTH